MLHCARFRAVQNSYCTNTGNEFSPTPFQCETATELRYAAIYLVVEAAWKNSRSFDCANIITAGENIRRLETCQVLMVSNVVNWPVIVKTTDVNESTSGIG